MKEPNGYKCYECGTDLHGNQRKWCGWKCKKRVYWRINPDKMAKSIERLRKYERRSPRRKYLYPYCRWPQTQRIRFSESEKERDKFRSAYGCQHLTDRYVKKALRSEGIYNPNKDMLELKREQLKIHRLLKEVKDGSSGTGNQRIKENE